MVPHVVATSATIIPCGGNAPSNPLSIPVKSNQTTDEGMSLIVQLGTTSVGYTPALSTAVVSSNSVSRSTNFRPQLVASAGQQSHGVAKHRLPMQINRQSPQVNRSLQHANLPTRNIAALAKPIVKTLTATQQSATSPTIAGRVLASPVKDSTLDDDLLEGVVEKRPKYHKHLPLNYQYVLQDHNYGAPPPPTPNSPPKSLVNGVATANGLTRSQQPPSSSQQAPSYVANRTTKSVQPPSIPTTFATTTMSNVFGIGTRMPAPAEESDVESTDGEREVDPQGEETETAPEGEDIDDDSVTRCICDFQHDDGYMICCDKCSVWQHVDCMGIDRANIPEEYLCEKCQPRRIDKQKAIALQMRKKKELLDTSDSSSDTSSSSDTNMPLRKTNMPPNNRRRSEPLQRKAGSSAKQRREGIPRQNNRQAIRKKQIEKKPPMRRKSSQSSMNVSATLPEKCSPVEKKPVTPTTPVEQLRQWIDSYEEAVTNHYSPELRARISSIKINGAHSDLKLPTNLMTTPKYRVSLLPSGTKILMACVSLSSNQPLLELRGKYMLCGTSRPPRAAAIVPPPGPYIFHYKLPRENTEVCVDARTYGNDARFVRRSCKPNAEMRHCIEKGALHLYLVTTKAIDKNSEIMLALTPGLACVTCGDHCLATPVSPLDNHKNLNGLISPNNNNNNNTQITDKRRRGRRRTLSENLSPPKALPKPAPKPAPPPKSQVPPKISPTPKPIPKVVPAVRVPTPPPRVPTPPPPPEPVVERSPSPPPSPPPPAPTTRSAASNAARRLPIITPKKESLPENNLPSTRQQKKEAADKKNKMTREERKMEAIMKAFERMEKDQARRQEAQARQTQRKDSTESDIKSHTVEIKEQEKDKEKIIEKEELNISNRNSQRKRKFSTSKRKGRARSQSTTQPVLRPRRTLRRSQHTRERSPDSGDSSDESPVRPQVRTPTPPPHPTPTTPVGIMTDFSKSYESPPHNQINTSSSSGETPPTPMSKTAMLVAAAVGPLAPGFKFPKTKKGLMNSWLKSPESSPPAQPDEITLRGQGFGATKKRWLRQAISEECDSPNSRPDMSNSPTEHVAPPKKRRMARESVSEEHSFTPPTTPTHTAEALSQCGSSQESEGPDSPSVPPAEELKLESEMKMESVEEMERKTEIEEDTEESELEDEIKPTETVKQEEEDIENNELTFEKHSNIKTENEYKEENEYLQNAEMGGDQPGSAASIATKRKLSISEYRQRKQQGSGVTGPGSFGKPDRPSSPNTSATSSLSSSSSDEEGPAPAVIAKSLMLEAALDTNLSKKCTTSHLFDSAPTLVERQRENLTQRLKREFGLFLSDDEEQEKARKQANLDVLNKEKEKDTSKKKNALPPPPPPVEPPNSYQLFFPGVGHPVYSNRYPAAVPPTVPPYYTPPTTYYSQLPH